MKLIQFANLTGRGVNVAVVDSGIDLAHPKVGPVSGGVDISVGLDRQIIYNNDDHSDRTGHGTACAGIIRNKAPDIGLFSVRIFDRSLSAPGETLVAAIQWAIEMGVDVVNLSLGTTNVAFRDAIAGACSMAVGHGVVLVAAEHNDGMESYPAVLPEAIGVAGGKIYQKYGYFFRPVENVECVARGDEQRVCWMDQREILISGTSYAAPHITGIIALIREAHPGANLDDVREILQANALDGTPPLVRESEERKPVWQPVTLAVEKQSYRPNPGSIKKAACYPFNKEMHGMVRFRDLLNFEIIAIADPVGKGLVGKDAGEAIGITPAGIPILPRLKDALKGADTLILGYVDELTRIASRDLLKESIQTALDQGLHVFSFLSVHEEAYPDLHAKRD
ncbi:MAG: S8 family serine peptidase [Gemmatimonadota bacterium]|nr:S8 family serine peptidase [Gemmatimonadota bacterium]